MYTPDAPPHGGFAVGVERGLARPLFHGGSTVALLPKQQLARIADVFYRHPFDKIVWADFEALRAKRIGILGRHPELAAMAPRAVQVHNAELFTSTAEDMRMRIGVAAQVRGLIDADARRKPTGYDFAFAEQSIFNEVRLINEHFIQIRMGRFQV